MSSEIQIHGVANRPSPLAIQIEPFTSAPPDGYRKRRNGFVSTHKAGPAGLVRWYRDIDRDFIYLLLADPAVTWFAARVDVAKAYLPGGECLTHIVAFQAHLGTKLVALDVEDPYAQTMPPAFPYDALEAAYRKRGIQYRQFTRQEIHLEPRLSNAKLLARWKSVHTDAAAELRVIEALTAGFDTVEGVAKALNLPDVEAMHLVFGMAMHGKLMVDLSRVIGRHSKLKLPRSWGGIA
ncbi:hypothetical protein [Nitrospirillum viridazoti]|uniref:hypothetical protein n=1 Tax=Nitrospirillum viridazoti TaxID=3144925 RepID=UPI00110F7801|nr:hypothetical protein [Nitrospirillum amazonense]